MIQFIPVASGSGGNCYIVKAGNDKLLVECGIGINRIKEALNYDMDPVQGCLVSHSHGDHDKSVLKLGLSSGIGTWASKQTCESIKAKNGGGPCFLSELPDEGQASVGTFHVFGFEVPHDDPGTFGFVIEHEDEVGRILYASDLQYMPFALPVCDIIAIEANYDPTILKSNVTDGVVDHDRYRRVLQTHNSIDTVIEMLQKANLKMCREIWLIHLSDQNSNADEFKRRVQQVTGIPTYIAPSKTQGALV